MKSALSCLILCLSIACAQSDAKAIDLPAVFSPHAVFQMNTELPVWGTADPGTEVTVKFAGQSVTGKTTKVDLGE